MRSLRTRERAPLEALLGFATPDEFRARGRAFAARQVLDDAFAVYLVAFNTVRRAGEATRLALRGVTIDLLVQMAERALEAEKVASTLERDQKTLTQALANAQNAHRVASQRALGFREQARRVLQRVTGDDPAWAVRIRDAATGAATGGRLVDALNELAGVGETLLTAPGSETLQQRARLLAFDRAYVDQIRQVATELDEAQNTVWHLSKQGDDPEARLHELLGMTLGLMAMLVEAFDAAHEIESSVPILRPKFTQRVVVRRLSKLPPPVAAAPRSRRPVGMKTKRPAAVDDAQTETFHGGLGRRD